MKIQLSDVTQRNIPCLVNRTDIEIEIEIGNNMFVMYMINVTSVIHLAIYEFIQIVVVAVVARGRIR